MIKGIIDTHTHYDDSAYDEDRDELIKSFSDNGVEFIVNSGASLEGCKDSVELAYRYDNVYATIGIHPEFAENFSQEIKEELKEMIISDSKKKIRALGEMGLDYYCSEASKEAQEKCFKEQLDLALELDLPVVIHSRDAQADTEKILKEYAGKLKACSLHCYSYSKESAIVFAKLGFYFGIGGVVTFKNAKKLKEALEVIPLDRILLETDSPYLAPHPLRGTRNTSLNLKKVAEEVARIKNLSVEEIVAITNKNAKTFYGID